MTDSNNSAPLILFVDDEAAAVKYFGKAMEQVAPVVAANSVEEGKRMLDEHAQTLAVLVSDQRMPGECGNELLHYARVNYPHMVRILTTAYSELDNTVEAVNQGQIHRYIQKPWEISALRMEMKQALGLAALQKEHAQLLREKMIVHQQQMVLNRMGFLYALCGSLLGQDDSPPLQTYLSAAAAAWSSVSEPDWGQMDYTDVVGMEAQRNGRLGHELGLRLAVMRQSYKDWRPADGLAPLLGELEGQARITENGTIAFADSGNFAEYLQAAGDAAVSGQHVSWLALLIWLRERGCSLQMEQEGRSVQFRLETAPLPVSPVRMEEWVGRFCEGKLA